MTRKLKKQNKELEPFEQVNAMQQAFCHGICSGMNQTDAAKAAGYSAKNATDAGKRLMKLPNIKNYIDYINSNVIKYSGVTKLMLVLELKKIAFASIDSIYTSWMSMSEFENLNPDIKAAIESIETTEIKGVTRIKIKFYNKLQAIEMLLKTMGFNEPEKIEITKEPPLIIVVDGKSLKL